MLCRCRMHGCCERGAHLARLCHANAARPGRRPRWTRSRPRRTGRWCRRAATRSTCTRCRSGARTASAWRARAGAAPRPPARRSACLMTVSVASLGVCWGRACRSSPDSPSGVRRSRAALGLASAGARQQDAGGACAACAGLVRMRGLCAAGARCTGGRRRCVRSGRARGRASAGRRARASHPRCWSASGAARAGHAALAARPEDHCKQSA